jgi:hypothetical protein
MACNPTPVGADALVDGSFREAELMRRRHRQVPSPNSNAVIESSEYCATAAELGHFSGRRRGHIL